MVVAISCVGYVVYDVSHIGLPWARGGLDLAVAGAAGFLVAPLPFAFVLAPAWLWVAVRLSIEWFSPHRLIRHGSRLSALVDYLMRCGCMLLACVLALAVLAATWTVIAAPIASAIDADSVASVYGDRLPSLWLLVAVQGLVSANFLLAVTAVIGVAAISRGAPAAAVVVAAVAWLWVVVSSFGAIDGSGSARTSLDGVGLILHPLDVAPAVSSMVAVIAAAVFGAHVMDRRVGAARREIGGVVLLVAVLGTAAVWGIGEANAGGLELPLTLAVPLSSTGTILQFSAAGAFSICTGLLVAAQRSDDLAGWRMLVAIRRGSRWREVTASLAADARGALLISAALLGVAGIAATTMTARWPDVEQLLLPAAHWLILAPLQLTFAATLLRTMLARGFGQGVVLGALCALGVLGAAVSPLSPWLPFPFTNPDVRFSGWPETIQAAVICLLWIAAIVAAVAVQPLSLWKGHTR